jgi:hypothetical protein
MRPYSEGEIERKSDALVMPALAKHARKGGVVEPLVVGRSGSRRMLTRICSRAAESSARVIGAILSRRDG